MMSTVGAARAPDTAAAPAGAAGLFDLHRKSARGKHAFCCRCSGQKLALNRPREMSTRQSLSGAKRT
jgi:hypothetical protein